MRARLFESEDEVAQERLEQLLSQFQVTLGSPQRVLGVEVYHIVLNSEPVILYRDLWNVEIEGAKPIVELILSNFRTPA